MKLSARTSLQLTPEEVEKLEKLHGKGIKTIDVFRAGLEKLLTEIESGVE